MESSSEWVDKQCEKSGRNETLKAATERKTEKERGGEGGRTTLEVVEKMRHLRGPTNDFARAVGT